MRRRGLTLIEVLVAAAVLMLGVMCGFFLLTMSHRYARETPSRELAEALTRATMTRYWRMDPAEIEAELGLDARLDPGTLADPVLESFAPWSREELERMGHKREVLFSRSGGMLSGIAMESRTSWRDLKGSQQWALWGIYWMAPPDLTPVEAPPPPPSEADGEWKKSGGLDIAGLPWGTWEAPLPPGLSPYAKARAAAGEGPEAAARPPRRPDDPAEVGSRSGAGSDSGAGAHGAGNVFTRSAGDPAKVAAAASRRREAAFAARHRTDPRLKRERVRDGRWGYAGDRLASGGTELAALAVEAHADPLLLEREDGAVRLVEGEAVLEAFPLADADGRAWSLLRTEDRLFLLSAEDSRREGRLVVRTLADYDGTAAGLPSTRRRIAALLDESGLHEP